MKNKKIFRTLAALCICLVLMGGFSVTAFAQGTDPAPAATPAADATNDSNVVVEETTEDSPPLTPEGNAALVDDYGGNKQLITVTTKAGNYFYILIDRANEDKETAVHFLNQVDEADLEALMEDGETAEETPAVCNCTEKCAAGAVNTACPVCAVNMAECTGQEPEPTPTAEPEPEQEPAGLNPAMLLVVLAVLGGIGALVYFKFIRQKPKTKGSDNLDDYDYGEDEELPEDETWETELEDADGGGTVTVKQVERRDKSEKPPALYDLTTLQRDANRLLGFTAQQTLDYLQNLYEKKLCTYPRTDSRYLTSDMAEGLPVLVNLVANAMPFRKGIAISCDAAAVINDKKVTDHHAVIPTRNIREADLSALPVGERAILELVALRLLCAVAHPYIYDETSVTVECAGAEFTAKGRTVKQPGWRALDAAYRASMKSAPEQDGNSEDKALPELAEGQELPVAGAAVKEGKTTPPKHFTEDTLLSAMETAGKDDMPEDAERKGLGTPATRAGILEKLVSTGFLERKKSKKTVQLLPSHDAISLITVLPEQLQSPLLTAEWEYRLGEIERGELAPEDFMAEITAMLKELVGTYQVIKGSEYLFAPPREVVGKCPRCGGEIAEMQKGFFCQDQSCKFAIWKNNKWWAAKRKQPTKAIVAALLKYGRAHVAGLYSEKSGKTYDATVVLEDTGQYVNFKLEFDRQKGGGK